MISGVRASTTFRRLHVFMHLLHAACARDDRADKWILQAPRQCQLRKRAAEFLCNGFQRRNLGKFLLIGQQVVQPFIAFERAAAVLWECRPYIYQSTNQKPADSRSLCRSHSPCKSGRNRH